MVSAQTTILTQDFEAGSPPTGWTKTQSTPSVGFEFGNNLGSSYFPIDVHTRYAASNDDAHDNSSTNQNVADKDYLISPTMDLTPYASTGVAMSFAYVQPGTYGSTGTVEVSTDGGSTWTPVLTVAQTPTWAEGSVDLSTYTSSSTVQVAFHHNDNGNWGDGFAVDDVHVYEVPPMDATVSTVSGNTYQLTGNHTVSGVIGNLGYTSITSFDLSYTVNGGSTVTQNFTGTNIGFNGTYNYSFTTPVSMPVSDVYDIEVTISNINGGAVTDVNAANDMNSKTINTLTLAPVKYSILTDHTGAWCGYCPDGAVKMDAILAARPRVIGVAVHNSDQMAITDGETLNDTYISGYPTGTVDFYLFEGENEVAISRTKWDAKCGERLGHLVPASVSITNSTFDNTTRAISVTVQADFFGPAEGEFSLNALVIEDGVTGTGNGYDQTNYYDGTSGHPFFGAGDPIVGYVHNHTLRQMLGGPWGQTGVVTGTIKTGDSFSHTFTWTLPANHNENNVKVVGMVQQVNTNDANDRAVLNSAETALGSTLLGRDDRNVDVKGVYPNPFSSEVTVEFGLQKSGEVNADVYDVFGKKVRSLANGGMNAGLHSLVWDGMTQSGVQATNGVYMIVIESNGQKTAHKVVLSK
ncbi:MAG: Omp28-related outer membrane protein [Bacteroidia bacterium]|nr:Omp28-related outer membrane protein [Bacteroidia bacterium]